MAGYYAISTGSIVHDSIRYRTTAVPTTPHLQLEFSHAAVQLLAAGVHFSAAAVTPLWLHWLCSTATICRDVSIAPCSVWIAYAADASGVLLAHALDPTNVLGLNCIPKHQKNCHHHSFNGGGIFDVEDPVPGDSCYAPNSRFH